MLPRALLHFLSRATSQTIPKASSHLISRKTRAMSSQTSPFTQAVVTSMRKLYPEALADKSFDNTGLLLEAPFHPMRRQMNSVLLTIDLTKKVADEALESNCSVVVAYHPIIFRGLKSLTFSDTQQASLLRLASEGISVYCPHTAVDAVPGGMADWMADIVSGKMDAPEPETHTALTSRGKEDAGVEKEEMSESETDTETETETEESDAASPEPTTPAPKDSDSDPFVDNTPNPNRPALRRAYSKPTYPIPTSAPSPTFGALHPSAMPHTRSVIHPSPQPSLDAANALTQSSAYTTSNTGSGRLLTFSSPQPLPVLIERIASGVGRPKGFPVAIPQGAHVEDLHITTVAICPGSGSHVFSGVLADLYFTGELSHHEALELTERGGCVVCLFHSNSERGYLSAVMRGELEGEVRKQWDVMRDGIMSDGGPGEEIEGVVNDDEVKVEVSTRDRDPFGIVVLRDAAVEGEEL